MPTAEVVLLLNELRCSSAHAIVQRVWREHGVTKEP